MPSSTEETLRGFTVGTPVVSLLRILMKNPSCLRSRLGDDPGHRLSVRWVGQTAPLSVPRVAESHQRGCGNLSMARSLLQQLGDAHNPPGSSGVTPSRSRIRLAAS